MVIMQASRLLSDWLLTLLIEDKDNREQISPIHRRLIGYSLTVYHSLSQASTNITVKTQTLIVAISIIITFSKIFD